MPPLTIMIKPVSGRCNMRCTYCFYADVAQNRDVKAYEIMSLQTLETLVRRAMAYADGECSFAFQGGEPTLAGIEFYEKLLAYQKKYNVRGVKIHNAIQTNGYDLPDALIDLFAREKFLVGVSLDGTPETHDALRLDPHGRGTSARVLENIDRLERAQVDFNILCVVNALVAREPVAVFETLERYRYLQFIACLDDFDGETTPHSLTADDYGRFLMTTFDLYEQAFMNRRPVSVRLFDNYLGILMGQQPENCAMCGHCGRYYLIEGDGGCYPCDFYVLDQFRMGNIREDSFFKLEKSTIGAAFRDASGYVWPDCRACRWLKICRGGCKRDREPFVDGKPGPNKWCASYRAFFEHAYDRMVRMARLIESVDGQHMK